VVAVTHADLVKRAGRWLRGTRKCKVVAEELRGWSIDEFPDAIGWTPKGYSIIVECKTSRSDFHADKRKPCRVGDRQFQRSGHYGWGQPPRFETAGHERWYLAPEGVLDAACLPFGCGLLVPRGRRMLRVVEAAVIGRPRAADAEVPMLVTIAGQARYAQQAAEEKLERLHRQLERAGIDWRTPMRGGRR